MMSISREVSNICKGFAILIIILCHVGNYFTRILTPLGGAGVSIFLILSGYGLLCSLLGTFLLYYIDKIILKILERIR